MAVIVLLILIGIVVIMAAALLDPSPEAEAMRNAAKGASSELAHKVRTAKLRADLNRIEQEGQ